LSVISKTLTLSAEARLAYPLKTAQMAFWIERRRHMTGAIV
jgi:hypothetical protein